MKKFYAERCYIEQGHSKRDFTILFSHLYFLLVSFVIPDARVLNIKMLRVGNETSENHSQTCLCSPQSIIEECLLPQQFYLGFYLYSSTSIPPTSFAKLA